jgi:hypothetical protein
MIDILIDMTNKNKRSLGGVGLCHYCNSFIRPHGKIVDLTRDREAVLMKNGSVKCGVCVREDLEKTTKLLNRGKDLI